MDSLKESESVSLSNYNEIEKKVDALTKEKQVSTASYDPIYISLFVPIGVILLLLSAIYSHFLICIIGIFLLFWGPLSYSIEIRFEE